MTMAPYYRKAMLVVLLLLVTGCSSTTFVYNRLDFIIPWYIGKYVDLERPQKQFLQQELDPFLAWHRSEELPAYLLILEDTQRRLNGTLTGADIADLVEQVERAWARTEERGLAWMIALGEQLSAEQMREFIAELREKQEEYEDEYLTRSDEEYREDAYDNLKDSTRDYLGRLDWGQRGIYEDAAAQLRRSDAVWLRERAAWLDRLESILARETGWQQALRDSLQQREQTTSAEYRAVYEHNAQVVYGALARVLNSRSEKQDRRLRAKLDDLREDLEELIAEAEPA